LEEYARIEIDEILHQLKEANGAPLVPNCLFISGITNIIWQLIAAKRYPRSDKKMKKLLERRI